MTHPLPSSFHNGNDSSGPLSEAEEARHHPLEQSPSQHLHQRHSSPAAMPSAQPQPGSPPNDSIHIDVPGITSPSHTPGGDIDAHQQRQSLSSLEQRRQVLNSLWGIKPYKGHITKRSITERSEIVKELYKPVAGWEALQKAVTAKKRNRMIGLGNIMYTMFFGWWIALVYLIVGCLCIVSVIEFPYGKKCLSLAIYYFWPFGKYLEIIETKIDEETAYLLDHQNGGNVPATVKRSADASLQADDVIDLSQEGKSGSRTVTAPQKSASFFQDSSAADEDEQDNLILANDGATLLGRRDRAYYSQPGAGDDDESTHSIRRLPFYVPNLYGIHSRRTPLEWIRFIIFVIFFAPLLALAHFVCMTLSWLTTFFIPVAKVHWQGLKILYKDPIKVGIDDHYPPAPGSNIILCTYQAFNIFYYKYSVFGMNVILINLLPFVFLTLLLGYCFGEPFVEKYSFIIFPLCLVSTIPLAYYIGKAVSSISAQTSFAFGAVLNAAFGTIIELILYFIALHKGMRTVVMNSITGSLIGSMLLMPGAAMIFGGLKHKEQFFNRHAAGVSATLLLMSIIGAFTPSVFYQIYGDYQLECGKCTNGGGDGRLSCSACRYVENHYEADYVYSHRAKYLMYACSALLPLGYIFGLIFTLKTHAYLYEKPVGDPDDPDTLEKPTTHGAPEWSKLKCILILLGSTILFAFVAEAMISAMGPAMKIFHLDDRFASLTLIAVVPNISEYINAAAFGLQNNIVLSLEIGSVAAIQTALLQMPILVICSALLGWFGIYEGEGSIFTLIFPNINLYTVIFSVLIITYLTVNGRSNYFEGFILLLCYVIIVTTFFFTYQDL